MALFGVAALAAAAAASPAPMSDVRLAALIVGVAVPVLAGVPALAGRSPIGRTVPPPVRAADRLHRDVDAMKQAVRR